MRLAAGGSFSGSETYTASLQHSPLCTEMRAILVAVEREKTERNPSWEREKRYWLSRKIVGKVERRRREERREK